MSVIMEEKINTECLRRDPDLKTTLAFVALNEEGKPEFKFYREKAADTRLTVSEIEHINPQDYSMYHFGSIALLEKPASDAYLELLGMFRGEKILTSFDPNIRPSLIDDRRSFLDMFYRISEMVDIMKLSDDDLEYITGMTDVGEGLRKMPNRANALTLVTLGKDGAIASYRGQSRHVPTFNRVRVKDTTGCGDAFMAAIISGLLNSGDFTALSMSKLTGIVSSQTLQPRSSVHAMEQPMPCRVFEKSTGSSLVTRMRMCRMAYQGDRKGKLVNARRYRNDNKKSSEEGPGTNCRHDGKSTHCPDAQREGQHRGCRVWAG